MTQVTIVSDLNTLTPHHDIRSEEQVWELTAGMLADGWKGAPLVGYWVSGGKVQLLNGTHRVMAAAIAKVPVPVVIHAYDYVEYVWGDLQEWTRLMNGD